MQITHNDTTQTFRLNLLKQIWTNHLDYFIAGKIRVNSKLKGAAGTGIVQLKLFHLRGSLLYVLTFSESPKAWSCDEFWWGWCAWYWRWTQLAGDSSPGALVTRSLCKLFTPTDALSPSCSLCRRHSRLVSDFFVLWLQLCPGGDWFTETQLALAWTKRTFVPLTASLGGTGSLRITLLVKDSEVLLQIRILFVLWVVLKWCCVNAIRKLSWESVPADCLCWCQCLTQPTQHQHTDAWLSSHDANVHSVLIINIALGRNLHVVRG